METKFERARGMGSSMQAVDFRRMFTQKTVYIMFGIALVIPILILVMTTMTEGTVSIDPETGMETVAEGFDNVWQIIGSASGATSMDMTSMCNMNLMYFLIAVFVSLFISEDFKSGYAKNLFTVRAKKKGYVFSKIKTCALAGALMILLFFAGAMLGGKIAGLPFTLEGVTLWNILMCLISKVLLVGVFVPIAVVAAVLAKQKTWAAILGSLAVGMLLFMMLSIAAPLNASLMNVILCLGGSVMFSVGLGYAGTAVLEKTDIL